MVLDSEEQRKLLLELLREVPILVKTKDGKPTPWVTVANLEDGPPAHVAALLRAVREAAIMAP